MSLFLAIFSRHRRH